MATSEDAMTNLREAAERLKSYLLALESGDTSQNPYLDGETHDILQDAGKVAEAYLATVRADDEVPLDRDWLLSIGFEQTAGSTHLTYSETIEVTENLRQWWVGDWLQRLPQPLVPKTRGGLRRLCEALGVEVKC